MDRYASTSISPAGPGDARPTAQQIIDDENLRNKWPDMSILITGVSAGLGLETARALASTSATLFLTARNLPKARNALGPLATSPRVHLLHLDQTSLSSVHSCAAAFLSHSPKLNILITNAGIRHAPQSYTRDNLESHFQVNHLSHFLLLQLLLPAHLAASTPTRLSRVISLSSTAHRHATSIDFTDLQFRKPNAYTPPKAYALSKIANVYMTNHLTRLYESRGVVGLAVHPGGIRTGLQDQPGKIKEVLTWYYLMNLRKTLNYVKSPEQGAATTVWAATAQCLEGKGGLYLENCMVSEKVKDGWGLIDPGYTEATYDEKAAERMWVESLRLLGIEQGQEGIWR